MNIMGISSMMSAHPLCLTGIGGLSAAAPLFVSASLASAGDVFLFLYNLGHAEWVQFVTSVSRQKAAPGGIIMTKGSAPQISRFFNEPTTIVRDTSDATSIARLIEDVASIVRMTNDATSVLRLKKSGVGPLR